MEKFVFETAVGEGKMDFKFEIFIFDKTFERYETLVVTRMNGTFGEMPKLRHLVIEDSIINFHLEFFKSFPKLETLTLRNCNPLPPNLLRKSKVKVILDTDPIRRQVQIEMMAAYSTYLKELESGQVPRAQILHHT